MTQYFKKIWHSISYLGIEKESEIVADELKIRVFFNRCIFVGFFALLGTIFSTLPFIGNYAYLNLINCLAIVMALVLHKKGFFNVAKRIVVYSIFTIGIFLTAISGPDYLYHMGIITILVFAWVIFNPKKEWIELVLFFVLCVCVYVIGELNVFNAPDYSQHPDTESARLFNLIGYTAIALIFISFIRRLNIQYEQKLSEALTGKEELIKEVILKTVALEDEGTILEEKISKRTSELIEQKEVLELQNSEKVVLLKEIHHRVKNNLQIIVSLLNLQSRKFEDPKVLDAINETQNRIISMSLVHQRMYQTDDFVAVDFRDYSELLFENIRILYSGKEKSIKHINNITSELKIDIETAIPLGLVINEMITNSFKHAFNKDHKGSEIFIYLDQKNDHDYVLKYKDNGAGLPEDLDIETSESLGLELMKALIDQVNGELKFYNDDGAVFEISFRSNF